MTTSPHLKTIYAAVFIIIVALLGFYFFKKNVGTINIPDKSSIEETENDQAQTLSGITVPEGFKINIFAKDLPDARAILMTGGGMLISQTSEGKITFVQDKDGDGSAEIKKVVLDKLNKPHGME